MTPRFRSPLVATWALTVLMAPAPLAAQRSGSSLIAGIVLDAVTRRPVGGVNVLLLGTQRTMETDSAGLFQFANLGDGRYTVVVRAVAGDSTSTQVTLAPRERIDMEFYLGATLATVLPEVIVTSSLGANSGRSDFERRLAEGNGRFITREYIERRKPQDLMDLMRGVAGMRVDCNTDRYRCVMQFGRSPRNCPPQYYLDGIRSHPSILYLTLPTDVVGIEIYSGAAQVPAEFQGQTARCGVISIWTNNGRGGRP